MQNQSNNIDLNKNLNKNLIWIDLEMTGLNPETDKILEIATIITNKDLKIIAQGPCFVIHQPDEILNSMDHWNTKHHTKSGLVEKSRNSKISLKQAEQETLNFIKQYCNLKESYLAGNSVHQDKAFLRYHMPKINNFVSYRIVDVSTVKELIDNWYPCNPNIRFKKKDTHRALDDIKESIAELTHYKKYFFI